MCWPMERLLLCWSLMRCCIICHFLPLLDLHFIADIFPLMTRATHHFLVLTDAPCNIHCRDGNPIRVVPRRSPRLCLDRGRLWQVATVLNEGPSRMIPRVQSVFDTASLR